MLPKNYTLHIENPCDKDWDDMQPRENGRHCSSCEKTVVDFTNSSDTEMIDMLIKGKGTLCGRFNEDQLDRLLVLQNNKDVRNNARLYKLVASILLLAGFEVAHGQTPVQKTSYSESSVPATKDDTIQPFTPRYTFIRQTNIIKGRVIDSKTKKPLEDVDITLYGTDIKASTDSNGYFEIKVPVAVLNDDITLLLDNGYLYHYKTVTVFTDDIYTERIIEMRRNNRKPRHIVMGAFF